MDEFNDNRGTISNITWIKKGYPDYMLQEAPVEMHSFLASISNTSIESILIRKGITNRAIFLHFF